MFVFLVFVLFKEKKSNDMNKMKKKNREKKKVNDRKRVSYEKLC